MRTGTILTLSLFLTTLFAGGQTKEIPIGVKVEAEGGGKARGMWAQSAEDLTSSELKGLESLVTAEIKKQQGIKLVSLNYPENFIGVVVVAAKLPNGKTGAWYYVASSVLTVAKKDGTDELLTHDVFAGTDLVSVARSVGFQFATARIRAASGLWK